MCTGAHPFIPTPNTMQLAIRYAATEGKYENVLYVRTTGTPSLGDLQQIGTFVEAWWNNTYKTHISNAIQFTGVYGRDVSQEFGQSWEIGFTPSAGTLTAEPLPFKDSFAIKKVTNVGGHRRNGRVFIIGLTEGQVTRNSVNPLDAAALRDDWEELTSELETNGYPVGWVSYCVNGAWRTTGLFCPIMEWVVTDFLVDSQHRRKPNVGS